MKGRLYARLLSQHVYINLYQRLRKLHAYCNHFYRRNPFISLIINRLQPRLFVYRSLSYPSFCSPRPRYYSPWFMLSGVSCHFWNQKGINEDEIWETVNDFEKLFTPHQANSTVNTNQNKNLTLSPPQSVPIKLYSNLSTQSTNAETIYSSEDDEGASEENEENQPEMKSDSLGANDSNNTNNLLTAKGWEAIILRDNFQVWRRGIHSNGLYQYKVFGTFTDVSAKSFFTVQRDLEYRKTWDHLVIKLEIVDKQNEFKKAREGDQLVDSGNEVIHWIMHYPFPMYSRDYCYVRRAIIDYRNNFMVLVSRAVDHPNCPVSSKYVRVSDYESQMVIKPHTTFEENGFDYLLTYFDDPRSAFPNPAYNWMAASGVPNFVESLHKAALQLYNSNNNNNNNNNNNRKSRKSSSDSLDNSSKNCNKPLNNLYIQCISFNPPQQEKIDC